ncbi:PAS domain S-box protein [Lentzea aerocolonigenes]|uniref:PAS domain S-box protein n=1 Tax=Lentzea aerocolonigenes TaxID=68170 RepID=UPI00068ADB62|nr:PAS domain S-box protein [Lentzea aerocolonigenes]MCP2243566.1 PAS domain S-box-containing protein [Lentzea aerocolonigenes]
MEYSARSALRSSRIVGSTVVIVIAIAGITLLGHATGVRILTSMVPGAATTRSISALMLVLLAFGLWLIAPAAASTPRRRAGQALGAVVALTGALVAAEYLTGWHFGVDTLLFPARAREWAVTSFPGRPSPHTAVAFVLSGLALVLMDTDGRRGHRPAAVLAPAGALVATTALLGHAYGLTYLAGDSRVGQMPFNTALCLIFLSTGLVACRPDRTTARVFLGGAEGGDVFRQLRLAMTVLFVLFALLLNAVGDKDAGSQNAVITVSTAATVLILYAVFLRAGSDLDRAGRTQRKLLSELRRERDFNRTVLRSLREGVLIADPRGKVLEVNPRWCEITGYHKEKAVGAEPPYPWLPAGSGAVAEDGAEEDVLLCRHDGTEIAVQMTTTRVCDEEGTRLIVSSYRDLTSRNKAEAERQRSAERLDHFFDISTDLLCIAGTDGYFKHLNAAWERTLGYTAEELKSRPYVDFVHPDDVARTAAESAEQVALNRTTLMFDNRYRCRDGSYRWLTWNAVPIPDEGLVYAVARDTTAQRAADDAAARLAAIVKGTDDAVIGQTLDGIITSWNPAAERQYGYTAEEAVGRSIDLIVPAGERDELGGLLQTDGDQSIRLHDIVRVRKDGSRLHVEVSVSPIRDSAGQIVGVSSIARDVTERIKAEQRFQQLVLAAPDAMLIVDEHGTIVLVNEQTERLFGYRRDDLVGQSIELLIPARLRQKHIGHRQRYLQDPVHRRMGTGIELAGMRHDGSHIPVEISLAPLDTEQGTLVSAAIRDISERREAELKLADARDKALAAAQLKTQFVAMVSHEIRTPMNGVIGLTDLLLQTPLEPSQRRYAEAIQTSGRALLSIINDILDFSKIEAGKLKLIHAEFELDRVLEEVVQAVAQAARDKHVEVVCDYPPNLPTALRGDDGRLRQALLNLLGNAVKFTEEGSVLLRAEPQEDDSHRVTFTVLDTGIGIAPEDLARLTEPFSQADAASTRRYGGTGLGLTITRQLVELMGGTLDMASKLGQGSRFWFTIGFEPQEHPAAQRTRLPLRSHMTGNRLLVIDDNPTNLHLISRHAKAWGMDPTAVSDGLAGLEHLREAARTDVPFELAVVDQHMPSFDGVALIDAIAADAGIPPVKVVLLTSGSYRDDQRAEASGAAALLPKPIGPSQLYNCLLEILTPETSTPKPRHPVETPATASRGLILLAEDNEINQMVAVETLTMLGYQVDVAQDGYEVLELADTRPYLAILMDCQMPRMDGYTATAELRRREHGGRRIPIIAMTAHALAEDRDRCLAAGMDDYLTKPIDSHKLQRTLDEWSASTLA